VDYKLMGFPFVSATAARSRMRRARRARDSLAITLASSWSAIRRRRPLRRVRLAGSPPERDGLGADYPEGTSLPGAGELLLARFAEGFTIFCWQVTLRSKGSGAVPGGVVLSGSRRGWHLEMLVAAGLGLIGPDLDHSQEAG
jgi:hypothetical protein